MIVFGSVRVGELLRGENGRERNFAAGLKPDERVQGFPQFGRIPGEDMEEFMGDGPLERRTPLCSQRRLREHDLVPPSVLLAAFF